MRHSGNARSPLQAKSTGSSIIQKIRVSQNALPVTDTTDLLQAELKDNGVVVVATAPFFILDIVFVDPSIMSADLAAYR